MRCPSCGNYSWSEGENSKSCTFCGYTIPLKSNFHPLGKVDIFKLARLLKEKEERNEEAGNP